MVMDTKVSNPLKNFWMDESVNFSEDSWVDVTSDSDSETSNMNLIRGFVPKTADDAILAGLQSVIEMCTPSVSASSNDATKQISNEDVMNWIQKEFTSLYGESNGKGCNSQKRKDTLSQIQNLVQQKSELDLEANLADTQVDKNETVVTTYVPPQTHRLFLRSRRRRSPPRLRGGSHENDAPYVYSKYVQTYPVHESSSEKQTPFTQESQNKIRVSYSDSSTGASTVEMAANVDTTPHLSCPIVSQSLKPTKSDSTSSGTSTISSNVYSSLTDFNSLKLMDKDGVAYYICSVCGAEHLTPPVTAKVSTMSSNNLKVIHISIGTNTTADESEPVYDNFHKQADEMRSKKVSIDNQSTTAKTPEGGSICILSLEETTKTCRICLNPIKEQHTSANEGDSVCGKCFEQTEEVPCEHMEDQHSSGRCFTQPELIVSANSLEEHSEKNKTRYCKKVEVDLYHGRRCKCKYVAISPVHKSPSSIESRKASGSTTNSKSRRSILIIKESSQESLKRSLIASSEPLNSDHQREETNPKCRCTCGYQDECRLLTKTKPRDKEKLRKKHSRSASSESLKWASKSVERLKEVTCEKICRFRLDCIQEQRDSGNSLEEDTEKNQKCDSVNLEADLRHGPRCNCKYITPKPVYKSQSSQTNLIENRKHLDSSTASKSPSSTSQERLKELHCENPCRFRLDHIDDQHASGNSLENDSEKNEKCYVKEDPHHGPRCKCKNVVPCPVYTSQSSQTNLLIERKKQSRSSTISKKPGSSLIIKETSQESLNQSLSASSELLNRARKSADRLSDVKNPTCRCTCEYKGECRLLTNTKLRRKKMLRNKSVEAFEMRPCTGEKANQTEIVPCQDAAAETLTVQTIRSRNSLFQNSSESSLPNSTDRKSSPDSVLTPIESKPSVTSENESVSEATSPTVSELFEQALRSVESKQSAESDDKESVSETISPTASAESGLFGQALIFLEDIALTNKSNDPPKQSNKSSQDSIDLLTRVESVHPARVCKCVSVTPPRNSTSTEIDIRLEPITEAVELPLSSNQSIIKNEGNEEETIEAEDEEIIEALVQSVPMEQVTPSANTITIKPKYFDKTMSIESPKVLKVPLNQTQRKAVDEEKLQQPKVKLEIQDHHGINIESISGDAGKCSCSKSNKMPVKRFDVEKMFGMSKKKVISNCKCGGDYCRTTLPLEVLYATAKITKFESFSTFEIFKSSKFKPKRVSSVAESIFVMKNRKRVSNF